MKAAVIPSAGQKNDIILQTKRLRHINGFTSKKSKH